MVKDNVFINTGNGNKSQNLRNIQLLVLDIFEFLYNGQTRIISQSWGTED